jgi:SEC-C motif
VNDATVVRTVRRIDSGQPLVLWGPPDHEVDGYAVKTAVCGNPDCPCTTMWLSIHRVSRLDGAGAEIQQPVVGGQVSSDGTGATLDSAKTALSNGTVTWIGEQLAQEDHRAWLEERWRRARGQIGDPAYPPGAPPEDADGMVFFSEVFPYDFDLIVADDGRFYFADDQYCLQADCRCDEFAVQFVDLQGGARPMGHVMASLQRLRAPETHGPDLLRRLWLRLLDQHGAERIRGRFRRMRQVARSRRHGVSRSPAAAGSIADSVKPGRNASCPCGSGKKFKRCCGA